MTHFHYQCHTCGKIWQRDEVRYLCPYCSPDALPEMPLKGVLSAVFNYDAIRQEWMSGNHDIQLFSAVEPKYFPDFQVAGTPFTRLKNLGDRLGLPNLFAKNDGLCLSGSLKDRASFLMVAEANRLGIDTLITASTGNAACALSAICAGSNKKAVIFVPKTAPKAKLTQLRLYGADLKIVEGNYDEACRQSLLYSQTHEGLNRNTAFHPLTIEGKKTVALEIFMQNQEKAPDFIVVSAGDGVILSSVFKGFNDLYLAGLIENIPHIICVQFEKSDAIHHLFQTGTYRPAEHPDTVADSISVINPANAYMAVDYIHKSKGKSVLVNDTEIMSAQKILAENSGIYAEPAAATAMAGLIKLNSQKYFDPEKQIVLLITGNGLKDIDASIRYMESL